MRQRRRNLGRVFWADLKPLAVAAGLVLLVHLPGVFGYPLAGTEPHRVLPAHQMLAGEDRPPGLSPLVPTLYGQIYLRKPPGHLWLIAAGEAVLGPREWAWRLPSVLCAALTAAAVAGLALRHAGRAAAYATGLAFVLLVPLWSQSRTADIDAANTLAATLAAVLLVHFHLRRHVGRGRGLAPAASARAGASATSPEAAGVNPRPVVDGALLAAVAAACAAGALVKGPAMLPIVVGAAVGPALITRRWGRLAAAIAAVTAGTAVLGMWWALARAEVRAAGLAFDAAGGREAAENLLPQDAGQFLEALSLPAQLLAFTLPTSIGVILLAWPGVRRALGGRRRVVAPMLAALAVAAGVCVATGMVKPRYAYPLLPLLAAVAGVVAARLARGLRAGEPAAALAAWQWLALTAGLLGIITFALLVMLGVSSGAWLVLAIPGVGLAFAAAAWARDARRRAVGPMLATAAAMAVLLVVVFNAFHIADRTRRSGQDAAAELADFLAGRRVTGGRLVFSQPEIAWYGRLDVDYRGQSELTPAATPADKPALLAEREWPPFDAAGWREVFRARTHSQAAIVAEPPTAPQSGG